MQLTKMKDGRYILSHGKIHCEVGKDREQAMSVLDDFKFAWNIGVSKMDKHPYEKQYDLIVKQ